jgi:2'-5' RNA ligase
LYFSDEFTDFSSWMEDADMDDMEAPTSAEVRTAPDGAAYTKEEFMAFFGGTREWDQAAPRATKHNAPTHFVAFRLPSPELHAEVQRVQQLVIGRDGRLAGTDVPPEKSHLTAFVLHCADDEAMARAREAMNACAPLLMAIPRPTLHLWGLGSFGTRVLYVSVGESDGYRARLSTIVDDVAAQFRAFGLAVQHETGAWVPHVTLLKTSRVSGGPRGAWSSRRHRGGVPPPSIAAVAFDDLVNEVDLGWHTLPSMELCAMQGVGADGFYHVEAALPFPSSLF